MPGSVYVIISTADLPMNTLMSRFILKKEFEPLQYLAVVCAMAGIAVCMMQKQSDHKSNEYVCDGDSCIDDWAPCEIAPLSSSHIIPHVNSCHGPCRAVLLILAVI
eukprot:SAG31_NODE_25698_length_456_cov_0.868347_1_plen_106_part_00